MFNEQRLQQLKEAEGFSSGPPIIDGRTRSQLLDELSLDLTPNQLAMAASIKGEEMEGHVEKAKDLATNMCIILSQEAPQFFQGFQGWVTSRIGVYEAGPHAINGGTIGAAVVLRAFLIQSMDHGKVDLEFIKGLENIDRGKALKAFESRSRVGQSRDLIIDNIKIPSFPAYQFNLDYCVRRAAFGAGHSDYVVDGGFRMYDILDACWGDIK
jgi:hypothetical protein